MKLVSVEKRYFAHIFTDSHYDKMEDIMARIEKSRLVALLTMVFILGMINLWGQFAGGQGTEAGPWQIETAEHLNNVRNYLGEIGRAHV